MPFDANKHSAQYIATHIARIEYEYLGNAKRQNDSMWRIASHCDLIPHTQLGESLTHEQIDIVRDFIATFKPNHHNLIKKCKEARL